MTSFVHYIYHKNEKGKPCEKDLPISKNDIPNNLEHQKPVVYNISTMKGQLPI